MVCKQLHTEMFPLQICPHNVSQLFDDVSTTTKLQNAVSAIVDWRAQTALSEMLTVLNLAEYQIMMKLSKYHMTVRLLAYWSNELRKISRSLSIYSLSVNFLHVAYILQRSGLNDELMDVLAVLVGHPIGLRRYCDRRSSELLLSKAANLMKAVDDGSKSRSTVDLIEIELSKAYLYRALSCEDSYSDSIYRLTNVYLAVLYYTTGQYQTAIDHCTLVMRSQDHSLCSSHVVQELVLKTDDDIDVVLGLAVFYQRVRTAALNQQQQTQHVTAFTTELFAHYLHIKCLSVTKCQQLSDTTNSQASTYEAQSYVKYITDVQQPFISDVLLCKLFNGCYGRIRCVYREYSNKRRYRTKCYRELNTSDLVALLQKSADEQLATYSDLEAQDVLSIAMTVTTDFDALFAYKRGDYQHCLQLSAQNVHTYLYAILRHHIQTLSFHNVYVQDVPTIPDFVHLLDDDIVSLTALTLIADPKCRDVHNGYVSISQLTLLLYLMTQCQLKLGHSVTSLAPTLYYIEFARRLHPIDRTLDQLTLKLIERKVLSQIDTFV